MVNGFQLPPQQILLPLHIFNIFRVTDIFGLVNVDFVLADLVIPF